MNRETMREKGKEMKPKKILSNVYWEGVDKLITDKEAVEKGLGGLRKWVEGKKKPFVIDTPQKERFTTGYNQALTDLAKDL